MLEIYKSRLNTINGRTVSDLEPIDQIEPDCWVNPGPSSGPRTN